MFQATVVSQQIETTVNNLATDKGYLSALSGERVSPIDSINSSGDGSFIFNLGSRDNIPGIYRLSFEKNKWIDFVNDGEDVKITTDASALIDSLKVSLSQSNRLYYSFQKLNKQYKTKSELLQLVLARYPQDDPYYRTTQIAATQLQKEYSDFIDTASQAKPASFIARYIRSSQLPIVDFSKPLDKQLTYLKAHALDRVSFYDEGLVHSDLFTSKTIEYLTYYRNPQFPKGLLEKEFMAAVDSILNRAKINQVVYRHITEYLMDGFKKFGFENCINYILDNYVIKDDLCLDEASGSTIQRMIDQKKKLPIGAFVPNITLPDTSGHAVSLREMKAEKILIVFYSTSCPYCQTMIPKLSAIAKGRDKGRLSVLAVSLDNSVSDWQSLIRTHKLAWTNVNDRAGWSGKSASDYFIYATPTLIVLNKEKKIIAKPLTIEELQKVL
jgi:thiol-disulfide isomerase/thioredoxin